MSLDFIKELIITFGIGACVFGVTTVWKKAASRWTAWFPPLRAGAKMVLIALSLAVLVFGLQTIGDLKSVGGLWVLGALALGIGALPLVGSFGYARQEKHERGAKVREAKEVARMVKKEHKDAFLTIGGVPIPKSAEPYHFMIAGSTGSGKSVMITNLLDSIRKRGDVALIVDSGGEFLSRYYDEELDFIINPFDDRCTPWSPLAELDGPWDAEALARSIIPNGTGESKEWNSYAQTLLTSVMQRLCETGKKSLKDLLWAVQSASLKELEPLLAGTAAAAQLTSEKTFGSIRTIASNYLAAYSYLHFEDDSEFSISAFIKEADSGFVFLTYRDDQLDSLRNLISCVLDVASRAILSLDPDPNRRVWLIIDEFASIGKVQSIEAVATKARKVGGCLLLGLQSVAQLRDRYGEHSAQTILSCLSSWMVLRCADADTAEYMSKYIGEEQITRTQGGKSVSDSGASRSQNEQTTTQRVILPSQIQQLANLEGFLKIAGHYPVCQIKLDLPVNKAKATINYAKRDFNKKPMLKVAVPKVEQPPVSPAQSQNQAGSPVTVSKPLSILGMKLTPKVKSLE